ncbi:MAG: hypothetical protein JWR11_4164 [Mycobacterium sp.]|nr:hypothetical protein [Mycobacterium sp.]
MSFWNWVTRRRTDRGWPGYIINGRIRTSTAALVLAFFAIAWVHNTYQPAPSTPTAPESAQVVPPGYMPDPAYTWVPRTQVQTEPRTTYRTTPTTTTTETTETETTETSPTETTGPTTTGPSTATTVVDPDGPGPLPPTTVTQTPVTSPGVPVPNRSGTTTTTTTTVIPGVGPVLPIPLPPG